jgi:hypothetical protein
MLLSEMVRRIADEEQLVYDTSNYDSPSEVLHDWTTRVTKNITLSKQKLVYVEWDTYAYNGDGAGRVLLDSTPLLATGYVDYGQTVTRKVFLVLPAGSYSFEFQTACWSAGTGGYVRITNIRIAAFNFSDLDSHNYDSGNILIPRTSTFQDVISETFTTPEARTLPIGTIKKYTALIFVYVENVDVDLRRDKWLTSYELNYFAWRLQIDGANQTLTESKNDAGADTSNESYGVGAYAKLVKVLDPNTSYTFKVQCSNYMADGASHTVRAIVKIVLCPWIIPDAEYEPVTLNFPQGSTLYIVLEPLNDNPTKSVKIGKKRGVSFGDLTDYYYTASGTDILQADYTFESVEVESCSLLISGDGGCISIIAVDVR